MNSQQSFIKGAIQGVELGVHSGSHVVEGLHDAVLASVDRAVPVRGRSKGVYHAIRYMASLVGLGGIRVLDTLAPGTLAGNALTPWQLHTVSGFNAAWGDAFHAHDHPWAIPMGFAPPGDPASFTPSVPAWLPEQPSPHLVVFVHGLGMNELAWQDPAAESYADHLAQSLDCQPLMLRYNTGLPIHDNGEMLAHRLEQLVTEYPVPVESLALVGHSMGGLIGLSAGHYGLQAEHHWPRVLRGQCCLGAPHQGAKLEAAGNWVTHLLSHSSYSAPLSLIGQWRSAGIKDLRHGSLRADDWSERDRNDVARFHPHSVARVPDTHYLMIATTLRRVGGALEKTLGDGLVTPHSALNPRLADIESADAETVISKRLDGIGHLGLLNHPTVADELVRWYSQQRASLQGSR